MNMLKKTKKKNSIFCIQKKGNFILQSASKWQEYVSPFIHICHRVRFLFCVQTKQTARKSSASKSSKKCPVCHSDAFDFLHFGAKFCEFEAIFLSEFCVVFFLLVKKKCFSCVKMVSIGKKQKNFPPPKNPNRPSPFT